VRRDAPRKSHSARLFWRKRFRQVDIEPSPSCVGT
jgi:hypothetical protein